VLRQIGRWIADPLNNRTDSSALQRIRDQVFQLCESFPLYPERRARARSHETVHAD